MSEHRYILEPYKGMNTRHHCPECKSTKRTFSLYIDTETGSYVHQSVGRCNRESNCGYHYTPKQHFQDNNILFEIPQQRPIRQIALPKVEPSYIPVDTFKLSLKYFESNNFTTYLINLFGEEITSQLIGKYFIGTSKHWSGSTVFWQIDTTGKIRTGKIMLYNATTGKRVKEPFDHITWVHKLNKQPVFELKQCLFGEHLLRDKANPVAIVESEKTAIIANVYLPQFIWLAAGGKDGLNIEKLSVLKGRTVVLFPDLKCFEEWSKTAKTLSGQMSGTRFIVSDLLERKATDSEKQQGFDLADYLIKLDFKAFALHETLPNEQIPTIPSLFEANRFGPIELTYHCSKLETNKHEIWDQDITELEPFFTGIALPTKPIKLNQCCMITDVSKFIDSHFAVVKANNGNRTFLPYLYRLEEMKKYLTIPS